MDGITNFGNLQKYDFHDSQLASSKFPESNDNVPSKASLYVLVVEIEILVVDRERKNFATVRPVSVNLICWWKNLETLIGIIKECQHWKSFFKPCPHRAQETYRFPRALCQKLKQAQVKSNLQFFSLEKLHPQLLIRCYNHLVLKMKEK